MTLNRIIATGLLAATVAGATLSGATLEARAGSLSPGEAAAIAGLGGFIVGGLVADSRNRYYAPAPAPVYSGGYGWQAHVARCYARYRSYDEYSDSYLGYDGYRHRCTL